MRLCSVFVPEGSIGRIVSIGQLATIAACIQAGESRTPCGSPSIIRERPIETPFWSFPDGNLCWHVMYYQPHPQKPVVFNPGNAGYDSDLFGQGPAVLCKTNSFPSMGAYDALANGHVPGNPVGALGMVHDIRFPWQGSPVEDIPLPEIIGPNIIAMFCSVKQTSPTTRLQPAMGNGQEQVMVDSGLVPEDKFMFAYPDTSRYHRVAGRMVVEIRCPE